MQTDDFLSCDASHVGDTFDAELKQDLRLNGKVVAPRGSRVTGHVVGVRSTNQLQNPGAIVVDVITLQLKEKSYPLVTTTVRREGVEDSVNKAAGQNQRRQAGMQAAAQAVHDVMKGAPPQDPSPPDDGVSLGGGVEAMIPPGTELEFKLRVPLDLPDAEPKQQLSQAR